MEMDIIDNIARDGTERVELAFKEKPDLILLYI